MTTVNILMWMFTAFCWWKIFEKAGIRGWKAIIPFYGDFVRFKMVGKKWMYIPFLVFSTIETVVNFAYTSLKMIEVAENYSEQINIQNDLTILFWVRIVVTLVVFIISIQIGILVADRFRKSPIFGIGLGVIPIVFAPIIAFDRSVYIDKREN